RAVDDVVLVVVMGDDWSWSLVIGPLVVGVDFAEMTPAVLIDDFPATHQTRRSMHSPIKKRAKWSFRLDRCRKQIGERSGAGVPLRLRMHAYWLVHPFAASKGFRSRWANV